MRNGIDVVAKFRAWMESGERSMADVTLWTDTHYALGLLSDDVARRLEELAELEIGRE